MTQYIIINLLQKIFDISDYSNIPLVMSQHTWVQFPSLKEDLVWVGGVSV